MRATLHLCGLLSARLGKRPTIFHRIGARLALLKVAELVMVPAVAVVEVVAVVVVEVEAGAATLARERLTHHMTPHARPALRGLRGDVLHREVRLGPSRASRQVCALLLPSALSSTKMTQRHANIEPTRHEAFYWSTLLDKEDLSNHRYGALR